MEAFSRAATKCSTICVGEGMARPPNGDKSCSFIFTFDDLPASAGNHIVLKELKGKNYT